MVANAMKNARAEHEVAIVGNFQVGKSTFVNCLVGRTVAAMGKGVTTTHKSTSYPICDGVSVIDTPGFSAVGNSGEQDEQEARDAIARSIVVIVYLTSPMDESCSSLVGEAIALGKRCVFIYNCCNRERWSPEESEEIRRSIEAEVENLGFSDSIVELGGSLVHSINALWALFGLGLLNDEKEVKRIRYYACEELGISPDADLKTELLRRSNILEIKRYLMNLPLEVLSDFVNNPERELKRICDRFCDEFTKRLAAKEMA